jgi:hypothetical protein
MTVCAMSPEGVVTCAYFVGEEIRNIIVPASALQVWDSEESAS